MVLYTIFFLEWRKYLIGFLMAAERRDKSEEWHIDYYELSEYPWAGRNSTSYPYVINLYYRMEKSCSRQRECPTNGNWLRFNAGSGRYGGGLDQPMNRTNLLKRAAILI